MASDTKSGKDVKKKKDAVSSAKESAGKEKLSRGMLQRASLEQSAEAKERGALAEARHEAGTRRLPPLDARRKAVDEAYAEHYDRAFEGGPDLLAQRRAADEAYAAHYDRVPPEARVVPAAQFSDPGPSMAELGREAELGVLAGGDESLQEHTIVPEQARREAAIQWALDKTSPPAAPPPKAYRAGTRDKL